MEGLRASRITALLHICLILPFTLQDDSYESATADIIVGAGDDADGDALAVDGQQLAQGDARSDLSVEQARAAAGAIAAAEAGGARESAGAAAAGKVGAMNAGAQAAGAREGANAGLAGKAQGDGGGAAGNQAETLAGGAAVQGVGGGADGTQAGILAVGEGAGAGQALADPDEELDVEAGYARWLEQRHSVELAGEDGTVDAVLA